MHHQLSLKRMGIKKSEYTDLMRICSKHEMGKETRTKTITRKSKNVSFDFTFEVPTGKGVFYETNVLHKPSSASSSHSNNKRDGTAFDQKLLMVGKITNLV